MDIVHCAELRNKNGNKWQNSREDEDSAKDDGSQGTETSGEDVNTSSAYHNNTDVSFESPATKLLSPSASTSGNVLPSPVLSSTPLVSSTQAEEGEPFVFVAISIDSVVGEGKFACTKRSSGVGTGMRGQGCRQAEQTGLKKKTPA